MQYKYYNNNNNTNTTTNANANANANATSEDIVAAVKRPWATQNWSPNLSPMLRASTAQILHKQCPSTSKNASRSVKQTLPVSKVVAFLIQEIYVILCIAAV